MQIIAARTGDHIYDGAGIGSLGSRIIAGLNGELLHRVGEWEGLILLEVRIGIACSIQPVGDLLVARSIGRKL